MENTVPTRVVVILDYCYSGSAKISKGNEEDVAKIGRLIIEQKSRREFINGRKRQNQAI